MAVQGGEGIKGRYGRGISKTKGHGREVYVHPWTTVRWPTTQGYTRNTSAVTVSTTSSRLAVLQEVADALKIVQHLLESERAGILLPPNVVVRLGENSRHHSSLALRHGPSCEYCSFRQLHAALAIIKKLLESQLEKQSNTLTSHVIFYVKVNP